jgi:hypothetical protein
MQEYINKIKSNKIKEMTQLAVDNLPEYFYTKPASSTGKYHMKITNVEGGLKIHTQICVEILLQYYNIIPLSDFEKDIGISAMILHDSKKYGEGEKYTKKNHDDLAAKWLSELWKGDFEGKSEIINAVKSHNGKWSTSRQPKSKIDKLVFWSDYMGSRQFWDKFYLTK